MVMKLPTTTIELGMMEIVLKELLIGSKELTKKKGREICEVFPLYLPRQKKHFKKIKK